MISILSIYTPFAVLFTIKYEKQILFCTQTFIFWSSVMNCDALRYIFFTVMKLKYREQSYFRGSPKVLNLSWSSSSTSSEQLPWLVKLSIRSNRMSETPSPAISLHSESLCSGATVVAGQVGRVWSVMEDWEVAGDAHGGSTLVEDLLSGETRAPRCKVLLLLFNVVLGLGIVTPYVCIYRWK